VSSQNKRGWQTIGVRTSVIAKKRSNKEDFRKEKFWLFNWLINQGKMKNPNQRGPELAGEKETRNERRKPRNLRFNNGRQAASILQKKNRGARERAVRKIERKAECWDAERKRIITTGAEISIERIKTIPSSGQGRIGGR